MGWVNLVFMVYLGDEISYPDYVGIISYAMK